MMWAGRAQGHNKQLSKWAHIWCHRAHTQAYRHTHRPHTHTKHTHIHSHTHTTIHIYTQQRLPPARSQRNLPGSATAAAIKYSIQFPTMEDSFLQGQARGVMWGLPISLDYSICIRMSFFISHLCVLFVTFARIVAANPNSNPSLDTYIAHTCTHSVRKRERDSERHLDTQLHWQSMSMCMSGCTFGYIGPMGIPQAASGFSSQFFPIFSNCFSSSSSFLLLFLLSLMRYLECVYKAGRGKVEGDARGAWWAWDIPVPASPLASRQKFFNWFFAIFCLLFICDWARSPCWLLLLLLFLLLLLWWAVWEIGWNQLDLCPG